MKTKKSNELEPNDVIKVGNAWFRCRYFRYSGSNTSIDLQHEDHALSPYEDLTCVHITLLNHTIVEFEVKQ